MNARQPIWAFEEPIIKSIYKCKSLHLAAVAAAILYAGAAFADGWPVSVVGNWTAAANTVTGSLQIQTQGAVGNCRPITGTIFGDPINGFYCPFSGRITFLRKTASTNDTFQVYSGNLSQQVAGIPLRIGGLFANIFGALGEYNFSAFK